MYTHPAPREHNGILDYAEKDFYWGLFDRAQMQRFLDTARRVGYVEARAQTTFAVDKPEKLRQYIDSFYRADFHFMLPLDDGATILDLGSGYGNITIPLARHYRKVVAVDTSLELLEFVKLRAESEGLTNIEYVHADPFEYCNLPFAPKQFDAVIVSGVLEWIGPAKPEDDPETLQRAFLSQIHSLLKDDSFLYLAIENRLFPGYLWRDPHSKLPFTTHLPRRLADRYARRSGHAEGYRTYIYGMRGYKRILAAAGFAMTRFAFPYTGYRAPLMIWPDRREATAFVLQNGVGPHGYTSKWQMFIRLCALFQRPGLFLSSFMIIASTEPITRPLSLLRRAAQVSSEVKNEDFLLKVQDTDTDSDAATFLLFHVGETRPYATVVVPRNPASDQAIQFLSMA